MIEKDLGGHAEAAIDAVVIPNVRIGAADYGSYWRWTVVRRAVRRQECCAGYDAVCVHILAAADYEIAR